MKAADTTQRMRRALLAIIIGLCIQLLGAFYWSPGTFVLTASFGVPLVILGIVLGGFAAAQSPLSPAERDSPSRTKDAT